jgi:hypothetical protein
MFRSLETRNWIFLRISRLLSSNRGGFRIFALSLVIGAAAVSADVASGEEQSYVLKNEELTVFVDANWAGGGQGGYYPLRIRALNTGPSRELTFRFQPAYGHRLPTVRQSVQADQNADVRFTLKIPLVGAGSAGTLDVLDRGKEIDDLKQDLRLPQVDSGGPGSPAVLVISDGQVSLKRLERAANCLALQQPSSYGYGGAAGGSISLDAQTVSPSSLPESWLPYTTVDVVFVDSGLLRRIERQRRDVLLQWVQCGGTLVVYNVGDGPGRFSEVTDQLDLKKRNAVSPNWRPAEVALRQSSQQAMEKAIQLELSNNGRVQFGPSRLPGKKPFEAPRIRGASYNWPGRAETFFHRELMYGQIVAFSGDPFRGTEYDWAWLLQSLGPHRYQWTTRHGFSARKETDDFQEFLIPGVRGVPVYAFLFLITAFTILIGPLNYILLWKRKRLFLLVMTIPVIAFGTSIVLFGYSMISHGFSVKSRVRSLTVLDQRSHDAVTVSRVAMFAGMPPSGGLQYSTETAVFPIWPEDKEFENGRVDWSDGQSLTAGWLRSRTRTQFLTVNHRKERARLEVTGPADGKLKVANGFEWTIEALLVADGNGNTYYAANLRPGESAELSPSTKDNRAELDALLRRYKLEAPDEAKDRRRRHSPFRFGRRHRYRRQTVFPIKYSNNLAEQQISQFMRIRLEGHNLAPSTYLAVFAENPGLNTGVDGPTEFDGYHLLLGYY